jgi:hypothetical protein
MLYHFTKNIWPYQTPELRTNAIVTPWLSIPLFLLGSIDGLVQDFKSLTHLFVIHSLLSAIISTSKMYQLYANFLCEADAEIICCHLPAPSTQRNIVRGQPCKGSLPLLCPHTNWLQLCGSGCGIRNRRRRGKGKEEGEWIWPRGLCARGRMGSCKSLAVGRGGEKCLENVDTMQEHAQCV